VEQRVKDERKKKEGIISISISKKIKKNKKKIKKKLAMSQRIG